MVVERERNRQRVCTQRAERPLELRMQDLLTNQDAHAVRRADLFQEELASERERNHLAPASQRAQLTEEAKAIRERNRLEHEDRRMKLTEEEAEAIRGRNRLEHEFDEWS